MSKTTTPPAKTPTVRKAAAPKTTAVPMQAAVAAHVAAPVAPAVVPTAVPVAQPVAPPATRTTRPQFLLEQADGSVRAADADLDGDGLKVFVVAGGRKAVYMRAYANAEGAWVYRLAYSNPVA